MEAISQEEFWGYLLRKGWGGVSVGGMEFVGFGLEEKGGRIRMIGEGGKKGESGR